MRKPKTAAELLKKLDSDPEYKRIKKDQADRIHKLQNVLAKDEKDLVSEINERLQEIGCRIESVWDLVNSVNTYKVAYPVLNRHLDLPHHERTREGIIRALTAMDVGQEIKDNLLSHFKNELDPGLKWVLSNALRTVLPRKEFSSNSELSSVYNGKKNNTEHQV
jgi:hypothetical protein